MLWRTRKSMPAKQASCSLALLVVACLAFPKAGAADKPTDPATGLIVAEHWQLVQAHCGACHSYRLVTANRGDRDYWLNTLRWMQRTQNLWPIPDEQEANLLDYLAANYNESEWGRRPPLSPVLLPKSRPNSG